MSNAIRLSYLTNKVGATHSLNIQSSGLTIQELKDFVESTSAGIQELVFKNGRAFTLEEFDTFGMIDVPKKQIQQTYLPHNVEEPMLRKYVELNKQGQCNIECL